MGLGIGPGCVVGEVAWSAGDDSVLWLRLCFRDEYAILLPLPPRGSLSHKLLSLSCKQLPGVLAASPSLPLMFPGCA